MHKICSKDFTPPGINNGQGWTEKPYTLEDCLCNKDKTKFFQTTEAVIAQNGQPNKPLTPYSVLTYLTDDNKQTVQVTKKSIDATAPFKFDWEI